MEALLPRYYSLIAVAQASTAGQVLSDQTKNVFLWAISIAVLIAGVAFVLGVMQYFFSLDSQEAKKEGRDKIFSSLIGLIICMVSLLILNTINPQLAKLNFGEPIGKKFPGIYYSNGNPKQDIPAPFANGDIANTVELTKMGYRKIVYYCGQNYKDPLLITFYPEKDLKDSDPLYKNTQVNILNCQENTQAQIDQGTLSGESTAIQGKSFDMVFQTEGVYFFLQDSCQGYRKIFTSNQSPISEPFYGKVKSIEILGSMIDFKSRAISSFGVIFQSKNDTWRTASCSNLYEALPGKTCYSINNIQTNSATIFSKEAKLAQFLNNTGASFYSKPWGWETGAFAGYNNQIINQNDAQGAVLSKLSLQPAAILFSYKLCGSSVFDEGTNMGHNCETAAYKALCPNFASCPGSIKITGKYVTILSASNSTCQIFTGNINSIKETEFIGTGNIISSVKLIPIK